MNEELAAIQAAMEATDFATARDLADTYVAAHTDEFADYFAITEAAESESKALLAVVNAAAALRAAGLTAAHYRAEAFLLYRWDPQDVSGGSQPRVRNSEPQART